MNAATTQPSVVAGTFYPGDAATLGAQVHTLLARAARPGGVPRALVAPHAGYRYSGAVAATAYAMVEDAARSGATFDRVILLGPSHRVGFRGVAVSPASGFATPLGRVPVPDDARETALRHAATSERADAFAREHSVEVQLPFLQRVLPGVPVLPLVVGDAAPGDVASLLESLWTATTLVVVSSDLSHYLDYDTAFSMDRWSAARIEAPTGSALEPTEACGCRPLNALLSLARKQGTSAHRLDLRNSGDTAGSGDRVVGYGAWAMCERDAAPPPPVTLDHDERGELARIARAALRGESPSARLSTAALDTPRGCFVTLEQGGRLRGCIGQTEPRMPLGEAVAWCAKAAARRDHRFAPLPASEAGSVDMKISVLGPTAAFPVEAPADVAASIRPHVDGVVIEAGARRATFLPSVWRQARTPRQFTQALLNKAGVTRADLDGALLAWRYQVIEFAA